MNKVYCHSGNLLEQRERPVTQPGALHLTRQQDLLNLDLPHPISRSMSPSKEVCHECHRNSVGQTVIWHSAG
jgi:hypothetical protein